MRGRPSYRRQAPLAISFLVVAFLSACEPSPEQHESAAWVSARTAGTSEALKAFVAAWPNSDRISQARERLEVLEWRDAIAINSQAGYQAFLAGWPDGIFAPLAEEMSGWLGRNPERAESDTELHLDFDFEFAFRTPEQTEHRRNSYLRATQDLLECARLSVNGDTTLSSSDAILLIRIDGETDRRNLPVPGARWQRAKKRALEHRFAHERHDQLAVIDRRRGAA